MSCIELPDYLCPLAESYSNSIVNNIKESEQADGFKKRRAINSALNENISISYLISREKVKSFKAWYKNTLKGGSNSLNVYDILEDDVIRVRLISNELDFVAKDALYLKFIVKLNFQRLI